MEVPLLGVPRISLDPKLTVRPFAPKSARSFPSTNFQGLCGYVDFREGIYFKTLHIYIYIDIDIDKYIYICIYV